jgi:hypothetical protein
VAIGRLLLAHCDTLLLDEPYTGLDTSLRRTLTDLVGSLVIDRSIPAILVTHELADAQAFADRLAVIDRGELVQVGEPNEVVLHPASRRVAEFVGYLGFVPAGIRSPEFIPNGVVAGTFADRGLVLRGPVIACRPAGAGWEAGLRVGAATITCRLPDKPPSLGQEYAVTVLDPQYFASNRTALADSGAESNAIRPQQLHRL